MPKISDDKKGNSEGESTQTIARRELIRKYGAYTAPVVISLLVPQDAFGHNNAIVYSTSQACVDGSGGPNHQATGGGLAHCMIDGSAGGRMSHTVTNPGPAT